MSPLSQLQPGSTGTLRALDCSRSFRRRLMEMGLLPGTKLRVVRRVEVGGLVQLEVRGCQISLRLSEAEQLLFETSEPA